MRHEQEEAWYPGVRNEVLAVSDRAARRGHLACKRLARLFCQRYYCSAEGTFGPLQTCQVPLRLSHARGRDLEKTRVLSEVQNEIS
jgi:hypothetical protein